MKRATARVVAGVVSVFSLVLLMAAFAPRARQAGAAVTGADSESTVAALLAPQSEAGQESAAPNSTPSAAQDAKQNQSEKSGAKAEEPGPWSEIFHWFNFLLIIAGIVWAVRAFLAPLLDERARSIRADMENSSKLLAEADQRLSAVEGKLKRLDDELAELRREALKEASAEGARIEQAAQAEAEKILNGAGQEIDAAIKSARQELKRYASELAVGVAERKIRDSLTPEVERRMLHSFVKELAGSPGGSNGKNAPGSGANPGARESR